MTAIKKIERIIERLHVMDDQQLDKVFNLVINDGEDIHRFTDEEREALRAANRQIEAGNFFTHAEANKKVSEWLKK